jgi:hypothetical protein
MTADLKEVKKKIIEEWHAALPQLTTFAQNKLYKKIGPVVIGIELIRLRWSEEYRPYFVMYPLWKKDLKTSLDTPIILHEYYNKKHLQFDIPYEKHHIYFSDVLQSINEQSLLPFDGDISLHKMFSAIAAYAATSPLSAAPTSYLQAMLQERRLEIALYISVADAQKVWEDLKKINWDTDHFKLCGVDPSQWLQGLPAKINNRADFLQQIATNLKDKKLEKLQSSALTS